MKGRSLQLRSVIAAALGILISLVIVGAATSVLVSRHLHRSLDQTLRQRAVQIAQLNASAPALVTTPGALDSPVGGTQLIVEVVDAHDRIVSRSLSLGGRVLPTATTARSVIGSGRSSYSNARLGSERIRVYAAPLAELAGPAAGGAV
ncbi:MAG: two-component system, OmpR family, sensor kinase, partial [Solirubrobacteraceae bacterium]|nr:two-component system, OmpR family, sensor kinase [Solirubrobacteraceae bacterium]